MKTMTLILGSCALCLLTSCITSGDTYHMADNSYKMVNFAAYESSANHLVTQRAFKMCQSQGKRLKVLSQHSMAGYHKNDEAKAIIRFRCI